MSAVEGFVQKLLETKKRRDSQFIRIAQIVAESATCNRLSVGAVITKGDRILSTGFNTAPYGKPTCHDIGCLHDPQGRCKRTIHAEQMAIIRAQEDLQDATIYVSHFPCENCANAILESGITHIVYLHDYENLVSKEILKDMSMTQYTGGA